MKGDARVGDEESLPTDNVAFWNRLARIYDWSVSHFGRGYGELADKILADLGLADRVLEVGTGTGIIALALAKSAGTVVGVDLSPRMIAVAQKNAVRSSLKNVSFEVGSAYELHAGADTFDAVVMSNLLHVIERPGRALLDARRVLKKEGRLIAATYCHGHGLMARCVTASMRLSGFKVYHRFNTESFRALLISSGFEVLSFEAFPGMMPLAYALARTAE